MKLFIQVLVVSSIILVLLFVSATYFFVHIDGKNIFTKHLENMTKRKVTVGSFKVIPPLRIEIRNLDIEGMLKAEFISVIPSVLAFLNGNIGFNDITIVRPEFTYEKLLSQASTVKDNALSESSEPAKTNNVIKEISRKNKIALRFIFKQVRIDDAKINFFDQTVGPEGIKLIAKNVYIKLSDFFLMPRKAVANFEINGSIPWKLGQDEETGTFNFEGWIDLYKKDMLAKLDIKGIDGLYLYPYYSQWVDLANSSIQEAKLNFTSNINGLNNDVTADCHLELTDIKFKPPVEGQETDSGQRYAKAVLNFFKAGEDGKIVLDFKVPTKMDNPKFGLWMVRDAVEGKFEASRKSATPLVGNVFLFPIKLLEGAVRATTDLSKATIDGTFAIGKEIKDGFKGSFKKEEKVIEQ